MFNLAHIADTALLFAVAYILGCSLGYLARWLLHVWNRGEKRRAEPLPVVTPGAPVVPRPKSNAARLAAAAATDGPPAPQPPPAAIPTAIVAPEQTAKAEPPETKPQTLASPRDAKPDNLKLIKGIGPKIEASLNALGIFHFDQIAVWTADDMKRIEAHLAFKGRIQRDKWVEQARDLASPQP